jgi:hypothetical protein
MKHLLILPVLLIAACGGGLDTHEGVMDATIDGMNEIADVIKTVKDKKSAEAAKPKLEKLAARMKEVEAAASKLKGEPPPEVAQKMMGEMMQATSNMMAAMAGLPDDPEVHKIIDSIDIR